MGQRKESDGWPLAAGFWLLAAGCWPETKLREDGADRFAQRLK